MCMRGLGAAAVVNWHWPFVVPGLSPTMVLPRNLNRQSFSNPEGRCAIHGGCRSVNTAWLAVWDAVAGNQLAHA